MWSRFYLNDVKIVIHYMGIFLVGFATLMLIPMGVALLFGETKPAVDFFFVFCFGCALGSAMRFTHLFPQGFTRVQALMTVATVWVVLSCYGALPLWMSGHFPSFLDAWLESISGITDTGVTVAVNVNHMAVSYTLWRHILQLVGGVGFVVIAFGIGSFFRVTGSGLLVQAEGREEQVLPALARTSRFIMGITIQIVTMSTICVWLCIMAAGLPWHTALVHAFSLVCAGFATGGFSPMSSSIIYYHSFVLEIVLYFVMLAGVVNFALYAHVFARTQMTSGVGDGRESVGLAVRDFMADAEARTFAFWVALILAVFSASLAYDPYFSQLPLGVLRRGIFTVVSGATNTGFGLLYSGQISSMLPQGAVFALILAMGMGGMANSTSGGIKAIRVAIVFKFLLSQIKQVLMPSHAIEVAHYQHLGRRIITTSVARSALVIFLLYTMTYLAGGVVGVLMGYAPLDAIFESVSVASNAGFSVGITSATMPAALKVCYMIEMLAGRLEFLTLFCVIIGSIASVKQFVMKRMVRA